MEQTEQPIEGPTQERAEEVSSQPITAEQPEVKKEEVNIPYLLLQLKMEKMTENGACEEIDNKIMVLNSILEDLNATRTAKAAPFALKISGLEDQIIKAAIEANTGYTCDYGKVNFRKSYIKRSWSLDELDTACTLDAYIRGKIWKFREEKTVKATASVEVFL